ncbi:MAG: CDP-diacylglycerol--glycerol-3-phosphate 3-phosphatidyltransferase [Planctomycetia bacterium]|nr:CDP-diacylglycerol--glycerol-3-phosphate 3-phosphatidyltransferase [Planctomycetia bacterium]
MSAAQSQVWTIPNLLSAARLGLAIVLFVVIGRQDFATAALLFLIAASTDWIDGWWARHFQQVSRLGRIFDPLVDKVIVCGSFILLAALVDPVIAPWMAVVVVVRELVVTAVRAEMERVGQDFSAGFSGKLKMILQCVAIFFALAALAWPMATLGGGSLRQVALAATWAAVVATVYSGFAYLVAARSILTEAESPGQ